jgi:hypothetical protein
MLSSVFEKIKKLGNVPKSKKRFLNYFISNIYSLFNKRKAVLFDAPYHFHLEHLVSVIIELSQRSDIDVFVSGSKNFNLLPKSVKFITNGDKFPIHRKLSLFITTEFSRPTPYWIEFPTVYFGHGIGPKLNYAANKKLNKFDYIFSPCLPIYNEQRKLVKESSLVKVGLPILEDPEIDNCTIEQYFGLNSINKRTILYAPSWANQIEIVSDIESIIKYLERLAIVIKINIVISPHPMLFQPEKCSGLQFFKSVYKSDNVSINKPDSPISTLDLVKYADITISDISSILFEAMGMNKLVIFDGNRKLYESSGSIDLYDQILNICHVPEWESDNYSSILEALENDVLLEKRQLFISEYIFNLGAAKNVFINNVLKIIHS